MSGLDAVRVRIVALIACTIVGGAVASAAAPAVAAPANVSAPSIAGVARDGLELKAERGGWAGAKPISYGFSWSRCDASGETCEAIAAATHRAYKLTHEDVGDTLRVTVTATGGGDASSATSSPSAAVAAALVARQRPKLAGSAKDGQLLSVGTGTWKGTPPQSYSYEWQSCPRGKGACSKIEGATGSSYRVQTAQIGRKLRVLVTAKNPVSSATATSSASKLIAAGAPISLAAPTIGGTLQEGQTLSASDGEWAGTAPFAYSYQWLRCSVLGGGCGEISGATGATGASYTASVADLASNLAVVVTATNAEGSSSATSAETQPILGILPTNTLLPAISGTLKLSQLLSATSGSWSGSEPISYAYQWQLCVLGTCTNIAKAMSSTFLLGALDVANTVRVIVTATNAAGSTSATSVATGLIAGLL